MSRACPYCASVARRRGPERTDVRYARCGRCGSGYVVEGSLDFRAYYAGYDPELVRDLTPRLRARYGELIRTLGAAAPGRRLLEVGCGNGHLLDVARDAGWEVAGTELSRAHAERARARGLEVVYGDLAGDSLFEERRFDVVAAMEVLEHLPEPARFLAAAARRLAPGGLVYLTTPNFGSVSRRLLGPAWSVLADEHVALATPRGLALALRSAGLGVVRITSRGLYLGEYRRALGRRRRWAGPSRAAENAALGDRIEASRVLTAAKRLANAALGATGLGEALECVARLEPV